MKTNPKVSVIIPNYNHSRFLKQRIDSVLNQSYQDLEVIILDDRSTDNSVQIINTYRDDPRVTHIIVNEQNSGSPFLQWKKGIQLAKGEWVWIAESDDWCEPVFLETLLEEVDDRTALAFCQSIFVDEVGKEILNLSLYKDFMKLSGDKFIAEHLSRGNPIVNASMCIFRRKFYYNVSEEYTRYKFSGDWIFWIEIAAQGNVIIYEKVLNYFRKHTGDVSSKAYVEGLGYYEYFAFLNKVGDDKLIPKRIRDKVFSYKFFEFLNDKRVEQKFRKPLFKEFYSRLGFRLYLLQLKNFINVRIRRPLSKVAR